MNFVNLDSNKTVRLRSLSDITAALTHTCKNCKICIENITVKNEEHRLIPIYISQKMLIVFAFYPKQTTIYSYFFILVFKHVLIFTCLVPI